MSIHEYFYRLRFVNKHLIFGLNVICAQAQAAAHVTILSFVHNLFNVQLGGVFLFSNEVGWGGLFLILLLYFIDRRWLIIVIQETPVHALTGTA